MLAEEREILNFEGKETVRKNVFLCVSVKITKNPKHNISLPSTIGQQLMPDIIQYSII
jgi:hypothetical protein